MNLPYIYLPYDKEGPITPKKLWIPDGPQQKPKYDEGIVNENLNEGIGTLSNFNTQEDSIFLYIKLNKIGVWSSKTKDLLEKLKVELVKVITYNYIIVKLNSANLGHFKSKIESRFGYVKENIISFGAWTSFDKVFSNLKNDIKSNSQKNISVVLSTFNEVDLETKNKLRSKIESEMRTDGIIPHYNDEFGTYHVSLSGEKLNKYVKNSFVEYIRPKTKLAVSDDSVPKFSKVPEYSITLSDAAQLGSVCVIDSGVSKFSKSADELIERKSLFNDEGLDDYNQTGHGTQVTSLALFGSDLFKGTQFLTPKCKVISHKIMGATDDESKQPDLFVILTDIIDESGKDTNIFNLSVNLHSEFNVFDEPSDHFISIQTINQLDKFLRKRNVLLVNSCGNIDPKVIASEKKNYPKYLSQNPVFFPSFSRNIISVGAYSDSKELSPFTRLGTHYDNGSFGSPERRFKSPMVVAFGGDIGRFSEDKVRCISKSGELKEFSGTSFSAPLVSLALRIISDVNPQLKLAEGLKAALLSACDKKEIQGKTFFLLPDTSVVGLCKESIIFNFEGEISTTYADYRTFNKVGRAMTFKFYMPKGANSLDFVLVHSNGDPNSTCEEFVIKPKIELKKSAGGILKNADFQGNLDELDNIHFGSTTFSRAGDNFWEFQVSFEYSHLPPPYINDVKIRFGLSAKVGFANNSEQSIYSYYHKILREHRLGLEEKSYKQQKLIASSLKQN